MNRILFRLMSFIFFASLFFGCLSSGNTKTEPWIEPEAVPLNNEAMNLLLNSIVSLDLEGRTLVTDEDLIKLQGSMDFSNALDMGSYSDIEKLKIQSGDTTEVVKKIEIQKSRSLPDGKYTLIASWSNLGANYRVGNAGSDFIIPITNKNEVNRFLDVTNRELYGSGCKIAGRINFDVINGKNVNGIFYPIQIDLSTDYKVLDWDKLSETERYKINGNRNLIPPMTTYYNMGRFSPRILIKVLSKKGDFIWSYYMYEEPNYPSSYTNLQPSFLQQQSIGGRQ